MDILSEIITNKKKEVELNKSMYPVKLLEKSIYFNSPCVSLSQYLTRPDKLGVIAEFKRKSPSKGSINLYAEVEKTSIGYMQGGASALSILTDNKYFGGKNEDLTIARKYNYCPILRKDFVIDEYQIVEAKSIGADAILLLANVLKKDEIKTFTQIANTLGLEVLLELHEKEEIEKISADNKIIGVNNRNLKTFEVTIEHSIQMSNLISSNLIKVSESGISDAATLLKLKNNGYNGFLIGENFMKTSNPGKACKEFIQSVIELQKQQEFTSSKQFTL